MKTNIIAFAVLTATVIAACGKINTAINFYVKDQTSIQINSSTVLNTPLQVATPDITTNSTQEFENNNTSAALVKNVTLEEMKLSITNPSGKTFSFLKSIHLYISTNESDELEIAYLDSVPATDTTITLTSTKLNLAKYIKASSYRLRTQLETRETLNQTTDILVDMNFKVTAGR